MSINPRVRPEPSRLAVPRDGPRPGPRSRPPPAPAGAPTAPSPPPRAWTGPPSRTWTAAASRPTRGTTAAVLAVTSKSVPRGRVDAGGTRLRLRALHVMGHGSARIARALGVREMTIRQIVRGDARTVSPELRDKVTGLYDAWWDKRAPARTPFDRGAAAAARKRAIAGNWCAPAPPSMTTCSTSPATRPRQGWKPATGTGVAPDIRTRARRRRRDRR